MLVVPLLFLFIAVWPAVSSLPDCKRGNIRYDVTECGPDGGRWHVPVPRRINKCVVRNMEPIRQKSCDSSCPPGQFLDVSTLKGECKQCPRGTKSVGSSVRYDNWTILPPEFDAYSIENYDNELADTSDLCNATWIADGSFLRTSGSTCVARLTYSATIVQMEGSLTFSYYYSNKESSIYFETFARNEQCEVLKQTRSDDPGDDDTDGDDTGDDDADDDDDGYFSLKSPSQFEFLNHTIKLNRGKNLIVWDVEDWNPQGKTSDSVVYIKDIEVKGVSFSSECAKCPAGTFANKPGSSWCKPCPKNHFSGERAVRCQPCNVKTEYADEGSEKCLPRKPCQESDYIEVMSQCDANNQFQTVYKWIEPKVCSDVIQGSVKLPAAGPKKECPPCNPGMYLNGTHCLLCPRGSFGDGSKPCEACPPSTAATVGYELVKWRNIPSSLVAWCSPSSSCATPDGWQARGDYLDSGYQHADNVRLYLEINHDGFIGQSGLVSARVANTLGIVRIDFELDCDGPCSFVFHEDGNSGSNEIMSWKGRLARQNFSYAVTSKETRGFFWRFTKSDDDQTWSAKEKDYAQDRVKIYSIVITNTKKGGASKCHKCNSASHEHSCVECPKGRYFNHSSAGCHACAAGTYLNLNNTCVKCGPGLTSKAGSTSCYSNCHHHAKDHRHFDFSSLKGVRSLKTQQLFLPQGTPYFYEYKLSLCGDGETTASCHKNISLGTSKIGEKQFLNASICQMRIMPGKKESRSLSANVAGIGHQLMGIYEEKPESLSLESFDDAKLLNESLLYFNFLSHTTTVACPGGRSSWVMLRCDPQAHEDVLKFPHKCKEGTCDGCRFMFLWHSKHACPICTEKYYSEVMSSCDKSRQAIYYIWNNSPKGCVGGVELPKLQEVECSDMTVLEAVKQFQIPIGIVAFVVTASVASLVFLWYKNRVLKYKLYQRVAVNDQASELPDAPRCVEDEEDEKVEFRRGQKPGKKLMAKLKDFSSKADGEDVNLNNSYDGHFD